MHYSPIFFNFFKNNIIEYFPQFLDSIFNLISKLLRCQSEITEEQHFNRYYLNF